MKYKSLFIRVVEFHKKVSEDHKAYVNFIEQLAQCRQDMQNLQNEIASISPSIYETATLIFFQEFRDAPTIALETYYRRSLFDSNYLTETDQQKVSDIYNRTIIIAKLALQQKLLPHKGEATFLNSKSLKSDFFSEQTPYQPNSKTITPMPPPMAIVDSTKPAPAKPPAPKFQVMNCSHQPLKRTKRDIEASNSEEAELRTEIEKFKNEDLSQSRYSPPK